MREMNITPKIKIRDNTVFPREVCSLSSSKVKKTRSQIKYGKNKPVSLVNVVQHLSNIVTQENRSETTMEMEKAFSEQIIACSNKDLLVMIDKGKMKHMKEQLQLLKYEQIVPDWVFFENLRPSEYHR